MSLTCPKCNSTNRTGATFCDNCGAKLDASPKPVEAGPSAETRAPAKANWGAIVVIVVIVGAIAWVLASPKDGQQAGQPTAANPHGSGDTANPHAAMGAGEGDDQMSQMMSQIGIDKAALAEDPLDVEALARLYQTFAMINRQDQIRFYLNDAVEAFKQQREELSEDESLSILRGLVGAALGGNDAEGGLEVIELYHEAAPDDLTVIGLLGDVNYDMGNADEAIKWYTKYLDQVDPSEDAERYLNIRIDRATMQLKLAESGSAESLNTAIDELTSISQEHPDSWDAMFNLGVAYSIQQDNAKAEEVWKKCVEIAADDMERWLAESELAKLRGEDPPPQPSNPHGEMDMGGAASTNPHGGMGMGAGGSTNPHGGMDMGGQEGPANPHGGA